MKKNHGTCGTCVWREWSFEYKCWYCDNAESTDYQGWITEFYGCERWEDNEE